MIDTLTSRFTQLTGDTIRISASGSRSSVVEVIHTVTHSDMCCPGFRSDYSWAELGADIVFESVRVANRQVIEVIEDLIAEYE